MPGSIATRLSVSLIVAVLFAATAPTAGAQTPVNRSTTSAVPAIVMQSFQQAYPAATINRTSQERDNGRDAFRIDSTDQGRRRVVLYDAAGKVVEVSEQVEERELPKPVADAMRSHRRAIYGAGMKVTRNGTVLYHLTLKGTRKTAMVAKPDGTVVSFQ